MKYPVNGLKFKIGSSKSELKTIAGVTDLNVDYETGIEEYYPFELEGHRAAVATSTGHKVTVSGKYDAEDAGCEFVASKKGAIGADANVYFEITYPSGASIGCEYVIQVTNYAGGASTDIMPLEFELTSNGKPEEATE